MNVIVCSVVGVLVEWMCCCVWFCLMSGNGLFVLVVVVDSVVVLML